MGEDHGYHHGLEVYAVSRFNQIDERERTQSLRPIGIIALEPGDLTERYGLRFHVDERDGSTAALVRTGAGHQYMLLRHFDAPGPGTEVLASELSNDPDRDLRELLQALELSPQIVTWKLGRHEAEASWLERQRLLRGWGAR
jgi:hypothetical protein